MTQNKFLEKYPQLREPKIGDRICITTNQPEKTYFSKTCQIGDIGEIKSIDTKEPKYLIRRLDIHIAYESYLGSYWVFSNTFTIISLNDKE
jgi:hypothetical protein